MVWTPDSIITKEELEALDKYRISFSGQIAVKDINRMFETIRYLYSELEKKS